MRHGLRFVLLTLLGALSATPGLAIPTTMHFVTKPFAPYSHAGPDGRAAGPMVDLLSAACAALDWHCTVELLPWRRAFRMATQGEVDGVFPVVDSPARRQLFRLSPEVVKARYVLLARRGIRGPARAEPWHEAAAGCTIAAYGPSEATASLQDLIAAIPGARSEIELDHQTVLRKLAAGRYGEQGLALVDEAVAHKQRQSLGESGDLRPVGVVKKLVYAFAFAPQRVDMSQTRAFAAAIDGLCRDGRMAAIFKPYGLSAAQCRRP